jgi:hypothetical protein
VTIQSLQYASHEFVQSDSDCLPFHLNSIKKA